MQVDPSRKYLQRKEAYWRMRFWAAPTLTIYNPRSRNIKPQTTKTGSLQRLRASAGAQVAVPSTVLLPLSLSLSLSLFLSFLSAYSYGGSTSHFDYGASAPLSAVPSSLAHHAPREASPSSAKSLTSKLLLLLTKLYNMNVSPLHHPHPLPTTSAHLKFFSKKANICVWEINS